VEGGNFIDKSGKVLGQHKGYPFYTIGSEKVLILLSESLFMLQEYNPKQILSY
jgi:tRNA-specific 2-thiouridylase